MPHNGDDIIDPMRGTVTVFDFDPNDNIHFADLDKDGTVEVNVHHQVWSGHRSSGDHHWAQLDRLMLTGENGATAYIHTDDDLGDERGIDEDGLPFDGETFYEAMVLGNNVDVDIL